MRATRGERCRQVAQGAPARVASLSAGGARRAQRGQRAPRGTSGKRCDAHQGAPTPAAPQIAHRGGCSASRSSLAAAARHDTVTDFHEDGRNHSETRCSRVGDGWASATRGQAPLCMLRHGLRGARRGCSALRILACSKKSPRFTRSRPNDQRANSTQSPGPSSRAPNSSARSNSSAKRGDAAARRSLARTVALARGGASPSSLRKRAA